MTMLRAHHGPRTAWQRLSQPLVLPLRHRRALRGHLPVPSGWQVPLLALMAFGLLCLRAWPRLADPQVWDEDGSQNLVGFLLHGWTSLGQTVNGYLITIPKLITAVSASVSLVWYPQVSTLLAWALTVAALVLLARAPLRLRGGAWLAVICALMPADPEVFGLPLYTFWWSAAVLMALTCWSERDTRWRLRACLIAICSVSSPVCLVTLPLFLARAAMFRHRPSEQRLAAVAMVSTAVQVVAMWPLPSAGLLSASAVVQILPVFMGSYVTGNLFTELNAFAATLVALLVAASLVRRRWRLELVFLAYLFVCLAMMSASRVDIAVLHQANSGPRYFFLPYIALGWLLLQVALMPRAKLLAPVAVGLLLLALLNVLPVLTRRHDHLDWVGSLQACRDFTTYEMPVHYDGRGGMAWTLAMPGSACRQALPELPGDPGERRAFRTIRFNADTIGADCYRAPPPSPVLADGWGGVDRDTLTGRSRLVPGDHVLGSMRTGSVDKGSLVLRMTRGARVLYRTGSRPLRQTIEILGSDGQFKPESLATDGWVLLEFSSGRLPDTFDVRFTDDGDASGEWSAVAMRSR